MTPRQEKLAAKMRRVTFHGRYFRACCPFHPDKKTPSMLVFEDGARCLAGCGYFSLTKLEGTLTSAKGSIETKRTNPLSGATPEQIQNYMERGIETLSAYPQYRNYLETRGLKDTIDSALLGYMPEWDCYTIPVMAGASYWSPATMVLRANPKRQQETGDRYLTATQHKPQLYVPDYGLLESRRVLFVTFGIFDALYLVELGFAAATSTHGQVIHADWFCDMRHKIVVIPDRGEEATARRLAQFLGWRGGVLIPKYSLEEKDPNDFCKSEKRASYLTRQLELASEGL